MGSAGTGFVFQDANANELVKTILFAATFFRKKKQWRLAQEAAMACDFGWQRSAQQYLDVYARSGSGSGSGSGCPKGQSLTD